MVLPPSNAARRPTPTFSCKHPETSHLDKNLSIRPKPALPERSSSRPAPLPTTDTLAGLLEDSASLANRSNTVSLTDISAQNRPPRWVFNTSPTTRYITAKSPLVSPPQIPQDTKHISEVGESSRGHVPKPITRHLIDSSVGETHLKDGNPFVDRHSPVDLPDLFSSAEEDPFGDFYSVSSTSTRSENNSEDSQTRPDIDRDPKIHIVEADGDLFSPCASLFPEPDLKEDQAFFVAFEHFNHPDVARQQFQCRQGMLWDSAINILMSHYIHPSDLTEYVTLYPWTDQY